MMPPPSESAGSKNGQSSVDGNKAKNQKKKTSKFHRLRLGDDSPAATLDVWNSTSNSTSTETGGASASSWLNPS
ncbi:hypothetical protein Q5O12_28295, partial [Klebsiella pneumoniae]|uniref:hypothetical protein n=1 Tax=Klebsiella pneumoniae TaxID=573 RepID=UPI00272F0536